jgi:NAD(P)-dependent dehydrogenase (short-subunit alcohol dehydrogenase family)
VRICAPINVNLLGPMLFCRRPSRMLERRAATGFVTSENAVRPRTYQAGYTAAKAGLEGLARVLAMELDGTGVRSIVIRVGPTGSEFGTRMDHALLREALESWRYWGVQRHLHFMPVEASRERRSPVVATRQKSAHPGV